MPSLFCILRDAYFKYETLKYKLCFLEDCISSHVIPYGLRLHFNLAFNTNDIDFSKKIESILDTASSRILEALCANCRDTVDLYSDRLTEIRKLANDASGTVETDQMLVLIRQSTSDKLCVSNDRLKQKLSRLIQECSSMNPPTLGHVNQGSKRLSAAKYKLPFHARPRPHRRKRRRRLPKRSKAARGFVPTEEDMKALDPIVLADKVTTHQRPN